MLQLSNEGTNSSLCQQVWYADDSSAAGQLKEMRKWWDILNMAGPKFGYFPKPSKTILIVKSTQLSQQAEALFIDTGIKITQTGERHLGAVIGSEDFRNEYVSGKIAKWVQDIEQLSEIAEEEPQLAYTAFTKAMCMRWCFLQRTIPNSRDFFIPVEEPIRDKLIPALLGRRVNEIERKIFALPVKYGGLGILNPVETAEREFQNSCTITQNLTEIMENQETDLRHYNAVKMKENIKNIKSEKEMLVQEFETLKNLLAEEARKYLEYAAEKGAGAWLTCLPLQSTGFLFNKQKFRDGVSIRYGWQVPNTPNFCGCGVKNSLNHTLNCKLGGYVTMRHNYIRDFEANLLREVCKDVKVEPELLPLGNTGTLSSNNADKARLDVSAIGIWSSMERTFLDVRVMHPLSSSYTGKSKDQIYAQHENEKKRAYNDRILNVEKGSFSPLIFSTTGGMGPECTRYHRRVAKLIAAKRGEEYSDTINYIRTKLRIALLNCTLVALRGERGRGNKTPNAPISDLSLNIIPERSSYEV